ncbi:hypothetical protein SAMN04488109_1471 [Chryseolinea serpens]|uniref:Uncharacterized protein n=1 Tax=Chryseolinea serpens TaxID=947013 RepID=A0A1M5LYN7_9BACT|nr:hypothetical protein [Chryseolinea serpens]SHG70212.1 hypothetical protein SAMN04488109_1471 [Chryseolinea serpens]
MSTRFFSLICKHKALRRVAVWSICLSVLTSCGKDDDIVDPVEPKKIFSLSVDASYPATTRDNWVLLHDQNGSLIDFKKYKAGDVLTFETEKEIKDNKMTVTIFANRENAINYRIKSFANIPTGEVWTLKGPTPEYPFVFPTGIGQFDIIVNDIPADKKVRVAENSCTASFMLGSSADKTVIKSPLLSTTPYYTPYYMTTVESERDEHPKYKVIANPKDKDTYEFSYAEMSEFERILPVSFSDAGSFYARICGFGEDQSYIPGNVSGCCHSYDNSALPKETSMHLAFTSAFPKYQTSVYMNTGNYLFIYDQQGPMPESIRVPQNAKYGSVNKSVHHYTYTYDQPFDRLDYAAVYHDPNRADVNISWTIYTGKECPVIQELPEGLIVEYPSINFSYFSDVSPEFISGESHEDMVALNFKAGTKEKDAFAKSSYIPKP